MAARLCLLLGLLLAGTASASLLDPSDWVDEFSHGAGEAWGAAAAPKAPGTKAAAANPPPSFRAPSPPPTAASTSPTLLTTAGVEKWKKPDFCG